MASNKDVIRIVVADEDAAVREGLRTALEESDHFSIVGEATNGNEALALTRQIVPDILLLDIAMPSLNGFEVLRQLNSVTQNVRVILLAAEIEKAQIVESLRLGARGVVTKGSASEILFKSIECVMADQVWISRDSVRDLVHVLRTMAPNRSPDRSASAGRGYKEHTLTPTSSAASSEARPASGSQKFGLTARELEIVSAIVDGQSNRDIAVTYGISEYTVKHHLTRIFDKVGVFSRLELAMFAIHHDLRSDAGARA